MGIYWNAWGLFFFMCACIINNQEMQKSISYTFCVKVRKESIQRNISREVVFDTVAKYSITSDIRKLYIMIHSNIGNRRTFLGGGGGGGVFFLRSLAVDLSYCIFNCCKVFQCNMIVRGLLFCCMFVFFSCFQCCQLLNHMQLLEHWFDGGEKAIYKKFKKIVYVHFYSLNLCECELRS